MFTSVASPSAPFSKPEPAPATQRATPRALDDEREEARLIEGLLRDDQASWREFNERYSRLIYRCVTRVTARFSAVISPEDVREIYSMLFVGLLANDKKKLRSFDAGRGSRFSSWIGMLAIHTAYDYLRTVKREPQRGSMSEAEGLATSTPDPFSIVNARQQAAMVAELVNGFSDKDRTFIQLYFGQGLEPEVVAERMGISVKTVYSKKHKIRSKLELLMADHKAAA